MRYPNPTPAHPGLARDQARHAWRRPQRQGHARTFPFPNPEAKTASADGTAPARVWESRTPPPAHHKKKGGPATGPPFSRPHHTNTPHPPHSRTGRTRKHRPSAHRPKFAKPHRPHSHTHRPHSHTHRPHGQATRTGHTAAHANTEHPHTGQSSPHPVRSLSTGSGLALRPRDRAEHNQTRAHRLMR